MKIHSVYAKNFGSYKTLDFAPSGCGLSLIYGPTGAGKSTLPDVISWTLFGQTSKDGNADDVKSWSAPDEDTVGEVFVNDITVVRTRGKKNDLYWIGSDGIAHRGKDLLDSQRALDSALQLHFGLYVSSAQYAEGNVVASFFRSNAKARREVLEQVTDLSLPLTLAARSSAEKKGLKAILTKLDNQRQRLEGGFQQEETNHNRLTKQAKDWEKDRKQQLSDLAIQSASFETTRKSKVEALYTKFFAWSDAKAKATVDCVAERDVLADKINDARGKYPPCDTCGVSKLDAEVAKYRGKIEQINVRYLELDKSRWPLQYQLEAVEAEENRTEERMTALRAQANPHHKYLADVKKRLVKLADDLDAYSDRAREFSEQISALDQIYEHSFTLRGHLLQTAVKTIENRTNSYLETYFDSEFRVAFDAADGDSIQVDITKGGYACVYRQLSKGQRQLLKLCFSVSVMEAAANSAGVHFGQLWFDEALDGLSEELKAKAFGLFEHLAENHDSVFVIEHSATFQELFTNKYHVTMVEEGSSIDKC